MTVLINVGNIVNWNEAVTARSAVTLARTHVPLPVQSPLQPMNANPALGTAVHVLLLP
jgi:hypothetical protein